MRACNNLPQPPKTKMYIGVAEECCMLSLLAVPSCIYSFWHGVISTSYFIFILVSLIFYPGLALTVARGEMMYPYVRTRMRTRIVRARVRAINRRDGLAVRRIQISPEIRSSHVKIMVFRPLILALDGLVRLLCE